MGLGEAPLLSRGRQNELRTNPKTANSCHCVAFGSVPFLFLPLFLLVSSLFYPMESSSFVDFHSLKPCNSELAKMMRERGSLNLKILKLD